MDLPHYLVLHSLEVHEIDEGLQGTDQFDIAITDPARVDAMEALIALWLKNSVDFAENRNAAEAVLPCSVRDLPAQASLIG